MLYLRRTGNHTGKGKNMLKRIEWLFEGFLWQSRLVVLVAVIASLLVSFAVFYMASADVFIMLAHLLHYPQLEPAQRAILHDETIKHVVQVVDGYLLATVLLIFALGMYELFISRIDQADEASASRILSVRNLDDLKNRLAKVILMILVVKFFEHAIGMTFTSARDMLSFAGGIALIGLALYLTHAADGHSGARRDSERDSGTEREH